MDETVRDVMKKGIITLMAILISSAVAYHKEIAEYSSSAPILNILPTAYIHPSN
jgi:hypothetical protein